MMVGLSTKAIYRAVERGALEDRPQLPAGDAIREARNRVEAAEDVPVSYLSPATTESVYVAQQLAHTEPPSNEGLR
jgi:hypothetical protein